MSDTNTQQWLGRPWDSVRAILLTTKQLTDAERADIEVFVAAMDRMREATGIVTDLSDLTPSLGSALHFSIEIASIEQKQNALMAEISDLRDRLRVAHLKAAS